MRIGRRDGICDRERTIPNTGNRRSSGDGIGTCLGDYGIGGRGADFFTLFGVWVGFLSGKEAVRYLKHHKGHSKNASDH